MGFIAIDVETANADMASICQIGVAQYEDGILTGEWCSLVDPEDYFDGINIEIHGITEDHVQGHPTFPGVVSNLENLMRDQVCVCHTHFDRVSIAKAFAKYGLDPFPCDWLDSARVARRAWQQFAFKGYGLANVCKEIGYQFQHHDALEDAKAAGVVLLAAIEETGIPLEKWPTRVSQPVDPNYTSYNAVTTRDGNPEGDLYGEWLCFTGSLQVPRQQAADLAAQVGCCVASSVSKKTTMLVVGDQDITKLAGHNKSTKHRKAEQLASQGQGIRILKESDFLDIVRSVDSVQGD